MILNMESKVRFGIIAPLLTATLIFIVTALMGVWAAPDRSTALLRFTLFIAGLWLMIGIAYVARHKAEVMLGILGLICALLAVVFTVHFLLTVNWAEMDPQLPLMHQIASWIHYHSLESSNFPHLPKNITGGVLIMLLPLGLSGTIWAWSRRYWLEIAVAVVALIVGLFGLIMTGSRSAWLGFGLAIGYTIYFIWRFGSGRRILLRWLIDLLMLAFTIAFLGSIFLSLKVPEFEAVPNIIFGDSFSSRTKLWQDSLLLIQDYPFTGSGLGSTTMVYSSYVFLLHVPFSPHAHNLYMQIAIEQGIPGLIVFVAMVIFAILGLINVYQQGNSLIRIYCAATFAALIAMLGHGMVEADLYAHLLLSIIFLPFGFTLALLLGKTSKQPMPWSDAAIRRANQSALFGSLAPIVAIIALLLRPGAMAELQANMGTVTQTRTELAIYRWPTWPIQDELRRNDTVDLSVAIDYYTNALALNPMNVTAQRRLGQIAISLGKYESAQHHLEIAYEIAPDQRPTRQMLGEIYAIRGDLERAVQLWKTVDTTNGQLNARYWWYTHIGAEQQADWLKQAISQLNTTN